MHSSDNAKALSGFRESSDADGGGMLRSVSPQPLISKLFVMWLGLYLSARQKADRDDLAGAVLKANPKDRAASDTFAWIEHKLGDSRRALGGGRGPHQAASGKAIGRATSNRARGGRRGIRFGSTMTATLPYLPPQSLATSSAERARA